MSASLTTTSILDFYHSDVVPTLAAALVMDDQFPDEVLNEIRSSMTHLARANALNASEHSKIQSELDSAYRHLKRVCLDSLKICVLVSAQKCETAIEALTEDANLPNDVYQKMSTLREARKKASANEGQRPTDTAIDEYVDLYDKYDAFYQTLDAQFAGQTAEMRRDVRRRKERKTWWAGILVGFGLGIIGSLIASGIGALFSG